MIPPQSHEVYRFRHSGTGPLRDACAPSRIVDPTFPVCFGACLDMAAEACIVLVHMFQMDRTHMSHIDRPPLMTPPSFVLRPTIGRESVLANHAAPVDHLFSLARPAVAPPPPPRRELAGSHRAYSSELTPRSRTACPFPNLSALQSKRLGTERALADSAPRTGPAVRRQVSGTEARLDQPTDAMPESAADEPTKPSIPAKARLHRTGSQSVPSRCARVVARERNSSWVRRAYDDHRGVGLVNTILTADAIRLRNVRSQLGNNPTPPCRKEATK